MEPKSDCLFCSDKIKAEIISEGEKFFAIYNVFPLRRGHTMVLPKNHVRSLHQLEDGEVAGLFIYAKMVTEMLLSEFNAEGFDWILQDGDAAGQTVPHVHVHVIPRNFGDFTEPKDWWPALEKMQSLPIDSKDRVRLPQEEMKKIVSALRKSSIKFGLDK